MLGIGERYAVKYSLGIAICGEQRTVATMTITLEVTPELERALHQAADYAGVAPDAYILNLLRQNLKSPPVRQPQLSATEAALLQQINVSLSQIGWQRYHELQGKRTAETLTPAEQTELIALSDEIEAANAQRIEKLAQLAQIRQTTVRALINELGLQSAGYA